MSPLRLYLLLQQMNEPKVVFDSLGFMEIDEYQIEARLRARLKGHRESWRTDMLNINQIPRPRRIRYLNDWYEKYSTDLFGRTITGRTTYQKP